MCTVRSGGSASGSTATVPTAAAGSSAIVLARADLQDADRRAAVARALEERRHHRDRAGRRIGADAGLDDGRARRGVATDRHDRRTGAVEGERRALQVHGQLEDRPVRGLRPEIDAALRVGDGLAQQVDRDPHRRAGRPRPVGLDRRMPDRRRAFVLERRSAVRRGRSAGRRFRSLGAASVTAPPRLEADGGRADRAVPAGALKRIGRGTASGGIASTCGDVSGLQPGVGARRRRRPSAGRRPRPRCSARCSAPGHGLARCGRSPAIGRAGSRSCCDGHRSGRARCRAARAG